MDIGKNYIATITDELYRWFDIINEKKFDGKLPTPIITIQNTPKAMGHCTVHKMWTDVSKEDPGEENEFYEVNIASNFLNGSVNEIFGTLIHECVHLYNLAVLHIKDINGRKHTKKFATVAKSVGLAVGDNDSRVGYGYTSNTDELNAFIETEVKPDADLFKYFFYTPPKAPKDKKENKKFVSYWCPACEMEIKLEEALTHYNLNDLSCPICQGPFEEKPRGKRGRKAKVEDEGIDED